MKIVSTLVGLSIGLFLFASSSIAMVTTAMTTGEALAQSLVGPGITISNVTYTGSTLASGYFTGGVAAGIGIESGIVLTSGHRTNLDGITNSNGGITGNNGLPGDSQLNSLVPGYTTYDATVLKFDFVSKSTTAYFNYVFGSDEYNEWVGSNYNDVFGFFLGGVNYALIPGTNVPVSINNVNLNSYSTYYNNNGLGNFPFEYDGFTDVFQTALLGLIPDTTYTLMLGIADAGDHVLDSGVFIQGSSFSDQPIDPNVVPEPSTFLLLGGGLAGLAFFTRRRKKE